VRTDTCDDERATFPRRSDLGLLYKKTRPNDGRDDSSTDGWCELPNVFAKHIIVRTTPKNAANMGGGNYRSFVLFSSNWTLDERRLVRQFSDDNAIGLRANFDIFVTKYGNSVNDTAAVPVSI